jgi:hypothetical protein
MQSAQFFDALRAIISSPANRGELLSRLVPDLIRSFESAATQTRGNADPRSRQLALERKESRSGKPNARPDSADAR